MVLGGDNGAGCSALALAIALRVTSRAMLFTTEMNIERVHERALLMMARVPPDTLRPEVPTDGKTLPVSTTHALRERAPLVETLLAGGTARVEDAVATAPEVSLVVVDALEGLSDRDDAPGDALAHCVLKLKRLALRRNVTLILVAHLPALDGQRADRRPRLSDFGRGGAAAAHADLVLGLHREELYEKDLGITGAAELLILKNRSGPRGYVDLFFDARFCRFEDVMEE